MGAIIKVEDRVAIIEGVDCLMVPVVATDLRAGAALVIAGLMADGEQRLQTLHIDRATNGWNKNW